MDGDEPGHPPDEALAAYAEGGGDRERLEAHLALCARCTRAVADLALPKPVTHRWAWAAAAAVLLALAWSWHK